MFHSFLLSLCPVRLLRDPSVSNGCISVVKMDRFPKHETMLSGSRIRKIMSAL